jgi:hypothetical protein
MHFLEFFSYVLRTALTVEGERVQFIESMVVPLTANRGVHDELLSLGIVNDWFEYCIKGGVFTSDHKICAASSDYICITNRTTLLDLEVLYHVH